MSFAQSLAAPLFAVLILPTLLLSTFFSTARANTPIAPRGKASQPSTSKALPTFLWKNYYVLKVSGSFPAGDHQLNSLENDGTGYGLGYTFVVRQRYFVSLMAGFHSLYDFESEQTLGYFTAYNESLRLIRLYHPLYLTVGGRIGYMIPTESTELPLKQNKDYENEVMLGASAGLAYVVTPRIVVSSQLSYWGGTNSATHRIVDGSLHLRFALEKFTRLFVENTKKYSRRKVNVSLWEDLAIIL